MHHFVKRVLTFAIVLSVTSIIPTVWANHHEHEAHASQTSSMIKGEVRRIDAIAHKAAVGTQMMIELYDEWLAPLGIELNTSRNAKDTLFPYTTLFRYRKSVV